MKTKKGISPLIATVLIIGFTIVLAALVMQWGGGLFEKIKSETGISSEVNIICSSKLTELKPNSYKTSNNIIGIDNSNEQEITGFVFRLHKKDGRVLTKSTEVTADNIIAEDGFKKLDAFEVKTYTVVFVPDANANEDKVGIMPIVTASDGSTHTCTNEKLVEVV